MQILIFSDIHIHPHKKSTERLEDCIKVLDWVFQSAVDRKIKNIVFLGDLFHDRQKIDVLTYQKTFEVFEKYLCNNSINIFLLLGNHDLWHYEKLDISSVNPLRKLPGVKIINKPTVCEISNKSENFYFAFLPYTHNPIDDLIEIEKEWKAKVICDQRKILGGHISVDGAIWNVKYKTISEVAIEHDGDMVKVGSSIFRKWDKVFLGHYHAEQKLDDVVEYIGSPLQLNFGEAFQKKHIVIFDTDSFESDYIENDFSPKHFIIKEDELESYDLKGNFVRLEVQDITGKQMNEIRQNLVEKSKVSTLEIKQISKEEHHIVEDARSILYKESEMIEKYVEQSNIENLDKEILIAIGKEICKEEKV